MQIFLTSPCNNNINISNDTLTHQKSVKSSSQLILFRQIFSDFDSVNINES